mgnify:CR=1 FL=1
MGIDLTMDDLLLSADFFIVEGNYPKTIYPSYNYAWYVDLSKQMLLKTVVRTIFHKGGMKLILNSQ